MCWFCVCNCACQRRIPGVGTAGAGVTVADPDGDKDMECAQWEDVDGGQCPTGLGDKGNNNITVL